MGADRIVHVVAASNGWRLARARVADTPVARMVGLLGRRGLARGDGLVLQPCRSVHTWFMRFAIDVLFLDRDLVALRAVDTLRPFRLASGGRRARLAIELPAGTLRAAGVAAGQRIRLEQP
jgi:uncharacterized protein